MIKESQNENNCSYCEKIDKQDGFIDIYNDGLKEIYSKYRGYYLWPKIWFKMNNGKRVIIEKLNIEESKYNNDPLFANGKLNEAITEIIVKPEGKKSMNWTDFIKGYQI